MECYFVEFLYSLIRSDELSSHSIPQIKPPIEISDNKLVDKINELLNQSIYSPLTLQTICEHFNLSKSYICRIYKDYTGVGIMKKLSELKLKEAKKLLRQDTMNISQTADKLAYSGIHNFTRAFKNFTGVSPTDYKKRLQ